MTLERRFACFIAPELADADEEVREYYQQMTPQQRLDEMVELLNMCGWNDQKLERTYEFIDVPLSPAEHARKT